MDDDFTSIGLGNAANHKVVATNVTDSIRNLQAVLQYIPEDILGGRGASYASGGGKSVAGWLYRQKTEGKWKRVWCEYKQGIFSQKKEQTSAKACASVRVSFIEREVFDETSKPSRKNTTVTPPTIQLNNQGGNTRAEFDELYWSYLECHEATFSFKLFSTARIEIFRADNEDVCRSFVDTIQADLKETMDDELWANKMEALQEMSPLLREQMMLQLNRYNTLVTSLAKSGFMEEELPITSTRKEKCGVLKMEVFNEELEQMMWKDFYFVLFEGALFYYKDSKSTTPTGFITLRFASVELDKEQLTKEDKGFIFHVKTPLRTVVCRAKHPVALSEWIASLQNALNQYKMDMKTPKNKKIRRKDSMEVLRDINQVMADVSSFRAIVNNSKTVNLFKQFLTNRGENASEVDFYNEASDFAATKEFTLLQSHAKTIYNRFVVQDANEESKEDKPVDLPQECVDDIKSKIDRVVTVNIYNAALLHVQRRMNSFFEEFKGSDLYNEIEAMANTDVVIDQRQVDPFPPDCVQVFLIKVKNSKRSKEVKFKKKPKDAAAAGIATLTIGRDKSNYLVIDDSRVSRSHARIEYTDTQCEYVDLGSSCGSRLNGSKVFRAKLQPGDVIEIGLSSLIFQLKKKKRFSLIS